MRSVLTMWILLANLEDTEALSGTSHVSVVYHSDIQFKSLALGVNVERTLTTKTKLLTK